MPLNLISNFAANVAQRNLAMSESAATISLSKLSSGSRVVSAKDDAASLAVGSRLNAEVVGLKQAAVNAGQAISMLQIADGAMAKVNDILVRMKSLAVQAGSGRFASRFGTWRFRFLPHHSRRGSRLRELHTNSLK